MGDFSILFWNKSFANQTLEISWTIDGASYHYSQSDSSFYLGGEFNQASFKITKCIKKTVNKFYKQFTELINKHKTRPKKSDTLAEITVYSSTQLSPMIALKGDPLGLFLINIKWEIQKINYARRLLCIDIKGK